LARIEFVESSFPMDRPIKSIEIQCKD